MSCTSRRFACAFSLALAWASSASAVSIADQPVGWAAWDVANSKAYAVTGGYGGTVVEVSTLADLQKYAKASGKYVIYMKGTMGAGVATRVPVTSDKTIFGVNGATLNGGFDISDGANNVILRNIVVIGPGAVDVDGVDPVNIDKATHVWVDHLDIRDGQDGNLDIVNGSNLVTVSWTKFSYTSKSSEHRFSNLFGNSDSKTSDRTKLKITVHHSWWADNVQERMPRVRYGQVHVVNNLFTSKLGDYCVRAGFEADILVESNAFVGVKTPIDLYEGKYTAVTSRNNYYSGTSGNTSGSSAAAFTPPYSMTIDDATNIEAAIRAGAGATLADPRGSGTSSSSIASSSSVVSSSSVASSSSVKPSSSSSIALSSSVASSSSVVSSSSQSSSSVASSSSAVSSSSVAASDPLPVLAGRIEAESFCSAAGVAETKNVGFEGDGYFNFDNEAGAAATWAVVATQDATATLYIRYANASTVDRSLALAIDSVTTVETISFPGTGAWTTWKGVEVSIPLKAGFHWLTLSSLTEEGGPNVDLIGLVSSGFSAATSCQPDITGVLRPQVLRQSVTAPRWFDLVGRRSVRN